MKKTSIGPSKIPSFLSDAFGVSSDKCAIYFMTIWNGYLNSLRHKPSEILSEASTVLKAFKVDNGARFLSINPDFHSNLRTIKVKSMSHDGEVATVTTEQFGLIVTYKSLLNCLYTYGGLHMTEETEKIRTALNKLTEYIRTRRDYDLIFRL